MSNPYWPRLKTYVFITVTPLPSVHVSGTRNSSAPGASRYSVAGDVYSARCVGSARPSATRRPLRTMLNVASSVVSSRTGGLPAFLSFGYCGSSARSKSPPCRLMSRSITSVTTRIVGALALTAAAAAAGACASVGAAATPAAGVAAEGKAGRLVAVAPGVADDAADDVVAGVVATDGVACAP